MSMGARFIEVDKGLMEQWLSISGKKPSLEKIIEEGEKSIDGLPPKCIPCTMEQAWDAIRHLLAEDVPELFDGEVLEDANLGESCLLQSPEMVAAIQGGLDGIGQAQLLALLQSDRFLQGDFYWDKHWLGHTDDLRDFVQEIVKFFKVASSRSNPVLLQVG